MLDIARPVRTSLGADHLPRHAGIVAAQAGADLGRVVGKVLADDVQAERPQDRAGGFALEKELERCAHKLLKCDLVTSEAGGKSGGHTYLVAGARRGLDAEGAINLTGDGDLRHAVTLTLTVARMADRD